MNQDYRNVQKFIGMMVGGSLLSVLGGYFLDDLFNTTPLIMIILLLYVVVGSLVWLIKITGGKNGSR